MRGRIGVRGGMGLLLGLALAGEGWAQDAATPFFRDLAATAQAAIFPVSGRGLSDVESAFGPRVQTSTQLHDWHRGIDVDGTLNVDAVVAPLAGYFYDYRTSSAGGNIVILEHRFEDFLGGSTPSIAYQGQTLTRFYTWYLHLYDDGIVGNGVGSMDIADAFTPGQSIAQGTTIGILGNSGSAAAGGSGYGPHLHFELRLGTNSSLEFQLANPGTTQWGFDPHVNPMLLFGEPAAGSGYAPTLTEIAPFGTGQDARVRFSSGTDQWPLLERWEVAVVSLADGSTVKTHVLDYGSRTGFDASSTASLDVRDLTKPYVDPRPFGDASTTFEADLVLPANWLAGFTVNDHRLEVKAVDVWGRDVPLAAVPEVPVAGLLAAGCVVATLAWRRRSRG